MFYILYILISLIILNPVFEYLVPRLRNSFNFLIYTITLKIIAIMLLPLGLNKPIDEIFFSLHPLAIVTPIIIVVTIFFHYKRYKQFLSRSSQILSGK